MTPQSKEIRIRRRGLTARFLQQGNGEPLIYLHGVIGSKGWNPFLETISNDYTVFAPLQPGFEEVDGLETLHDVIDLALYYLDLLDELGMERVNIVGHFLGAMIAAEMAALCPHNINALTLIAPTGFWIEESPIRDIFTLNHSEIRSEMWHDPRSSSALSAMSEEQSEDEEAQRLVEIGIDMAAAGKFLWPIPDRGLKRRIHRVKAPVLLVWGDGDRIVPPIYSKEFSCRLQRSEEVTIPKCGHLPMLERPDELARTVMDFLQRA